LVVLLLRTRSERVFVSDSTAGEALSTYFNQRALGVFPKNRLCRGVLVLPRDRSEYLRGRRRPQRGGESVERTEIDELGAHTMRFREL